MKKLVKFLDKIRDLFIILTMVLAGVIAFDIWMMVLEEEVNMFMFVLLVLELIINIIYINMIKYMASNLSEKAPQDLSEGNDTQEDEKADREAKLQEYRDIINNVIDPEVEEVEEVEVIEVVEAEIIDAEWTPGSGKAHPIEVDGLHSFEDLEEMGYEDPTDFFEEIVSGQSNQPETAKEVSNSYMADVVEFHPVVKNKTYNFLIHRDGSVINIDTGREVGFNNNGYKYFNANGKRFNVEKLIEELFE